MHAGDLDHPIEVYVNQAQTRGSTPMAQKPRLDMLGLERLPNQRIRG